MSYVYEIKSQSLPLITESLLSLGSWNPQLLYHNTVYHDFSCPNSTMSTINCICHSLTVAACVDSLLPSTTFPPEPSKEEPLCIVSSNLKTRPHPIPPYHTSLCRYLTLNLGACNDDNSLTRRLSMDFLTFAHKEKKAGYTFKTDYTLDP